MRNTNDNAPDGAGGFDVTKASFHHRQDIDRINPEEVIYDEWGFWTDVITLAEHQAMYASGAGVAFSDSAVPKDNLHAFYDFEQIDSRSLREDRK